MTKRTKNIREKGKKKISKYFPEIQKGDRVSFVRDLSSSPCFPKSFHGLTGEVVKKQGNAYVIKFYDQNKSKILIINPEHLKKL